MNRIVHFEFASSEPEKTASFYREVFGWTVQKWEGPIDYYLVGTGDDGTPGIDGGLMQTDDTFKGTVNTIDVADIDATLAKILACGGEVVLPKQAIPGVGYQAYFKDSTGILVGIHQADPKAGL
jgi:uncharacterized protein